MEIWGINIWLIVFASLVLLSANHFTLFGFRESFVARSSKYIIPGFLIAYGFIEHWYSPLILFFFMIVGATIIGNIMKLFTNAHTPKPFTFLIIYISSITIVSYIMLFNGSKDSQINYSQSNDTIKDQQGLTNVKPNNDVSIDNSWINDSITNQIIMYASGILQGNFENTIKYLNPGIFQYMADNLPDINTIEEAKEYYISIISTSSPYLKSFNKNYSIDIDSINHLASYENDLIYSVDYQIYTKSAKAVDFANSYSIIATSQDDGKHWNFIENDPELTTIILNYKYPKSIVKQILN